MMYRRLFVAFIALSLLVVPVAARGPINSKLQRPAAPWSSTTRLSPSTVSTDIVISQVYGGGGNSGATYTNDFIELFNLGTSSVNVTGWTVQYASAGGSSWTTTALTGTIPAGAHFLIQEAIGAGGTTPLPTPDATGAIAMSATAGKVALVTNSSALSCGASNNCTSASIKDFVGYGSTALAFEGSAPAPAPSNTTADVRTNNGCTDTDSNSTDFTAGTVNPRNAASPATPCSGSIDPTGSGSASPNNPSPGGSVLFTVTVTPGTTPPSTGLTVVSDLTSIGGSSTQSFFDDGTNGDVTAGDNVFSYATTVAAGTSGGVKTIPFSVNDSLDRSTNGSFQLTVQATSNPSGTGSANPNTVAPGGSTTLTVTVTPGTIPTSTGIAVAADLTSIGGSATQSFTDAGNHTTFTFPATVTAGTTLGFKSLPFTITDAQARTGSGTIGLTVGTNTDPATHTAPEHELMGNPTAAGNTDNNDWLIERTQYVESYNCAKGIPNWVEWHLDTNWLGSTSRQDNYRADTAPPLPTTNCYIVQNTDYSGSGFDRGHDVPSADRTDTVASNSATFLMPNFIPQSPNNNQGIWNNMENYIRTQVSGGSNEAYIWMGNAGQGGSGSNGAATTTAAGHVWVPAYVWKIVMILPTGTNDLSRVTTSTRVFAVLTPNIQTADGLNGNWMTYVCPVSKIEQLTGMNFFPNVPASTASVLKQKIDPVLAPQTIAGGTVSNLTLAFPETYLTGNVTVTGNLNLGPETLNTTNAPGGGSNFTITLAPGATVTRMNGGMVTGNLAKQYNAASPTFTYPVGTPSGYFPVDVTPTTASTGSVTVQTVDGNPTPTSAGNTLQRYWTMSSTGAMQADVKFSFGATATPGNVANYRELRVVPVNQVQSFPNGAPCPGTGSPCFDNTAKTLFVGGVTSFNANWTAGEPLGTTAAHVGVSGRVFSGIGAPLRGVRVTLDDGTGHPFTAITNAFGYYQFNGVQSGGTYVLNAGARGYLFSPRVMAVTDQLTDLDLTALP